jgi:hypothetical protein
MKSQIETAVGVCVQHLLDDLSLRRATKYLSPTLTVKATRRLRGYKNTWRHDFAVTVGRPNYSECWFIKKCVQAREPFPVKKVQLKTWPKKKNRRG